MRTASVIVSDDCTYSLNGKISLFGIYNTDIRITSDPTYAFQLVFTFIIETEPYDPFRTLTTLVTLPGGDSRYLDLFPTHLVPGIGDQRRWWVKSPLLFPNPILRPGFIEAKVIHEQGEITTAAPAIVLASPPEPPRS
jgi:hypothetical protein